MRVIGKWLVARADLDGLDLAAVVLDVTGANWQGPGT